jgi:hypothetical protein
MAKMRLKITGAIIDPQRGGDFKRYGMHVRPFKVSQIQFIPLIVQS